MPQWTKHRLIPATMLGLFLAAGWLSGCCTPETQHVRVAYYSKYQKPQAGPTADETAIIQRVCLYGEPTHGQGWAHGPTVEIIRPGYVLENSVADKIPLWVCEHLGPENLNGGLTRPDPEPFAPDPKLAPGKRAELGDYRGSHYDRGHQAPSADESKDKQRQRDTFYLSNMVPQNGPFNQHAWKNLEDLVRNWAQARGEAYVITGPMIYDPKEDEAQTATGLLNYKTIGDHVTIPTHLYKIVVLRDKGGQWRSLAFVMENKTWPATVNYRDFLKSIHWIEERTGLNFMPGLDLPSNQALRQQLEFTAPTEVWPPTGPE